MTIKNLLCDEKLLNVSHIYGDEAFKDRPQDVQKFGSMLHYIVNIAYIFHGLR